MPTSSRLSFLVDLALLGLIVQLYRWWSQRRRRPQRALAIGNGGTAAVSIEGGSTASLADASLADASMADAAQQQPPSSVISGPPPRPGVDSDERYQNIEDDPRYFEGAELGKAQKAAMGQAGLTGQNTVSFDPASTLVRPSLRVIHGPPGVRYTRDIKQDDVVAIYDFIDEASSSTLYSELESELQRWDLAESLGAASLPAFVRIKQQICRYCGMDYNTSQVRLTWYRGADDPVRVVDGQADVETTSPTCTALIVFGAPCEAIAQFGVAQEAAHFPLTSGLLYLLGPDASSKFTQQIRSQEKAGIIVMTIVCPSFLLVANQAGDAPCFNAGSRDITGHAGVLTEYVRPTMRIITVPPSARYASPVKHDDVIIVPNFFCREDDWDIYYQLLKEMRETQARGEKRAEWLSWHEGSHLLTQNPTGSKTFQEVLSRLCEYFSIEYNGEQGTRFNWYRDGSDWKPFHHDSAAFNVQRSRKQNCTIGISFGASRELAFRHAKSGELVYFPQTNGMLFFFGKDVNIRWQHGINALPKEDQDGKGRISIILWGLCSAAVDEPGSPPMLTDESRSTNSFRRPNGYDSRALCRYFQRGNCSYGDRCRYAHVDARQPVPNRQLHADVRRPVLGR